METTEKLLLMATIKNNVVDYLTEELRINSIALKAYEENPIQEQAPKIKEMREMEAIKLCDRSHELSRHIAVIKLLIPTNA